MSNPTPAEQWRPVLGFEGLYEVSDRGRVRSLPRRRPGQRSHPGRVLQPWLNHGYPTVGLRDGQRTYHRPIHRLVLEAFVGPRPTGMECRHLDGDRSNADLANLHWGTSAENEADKAIHGTNRLASRTHCNHGHEFTPENTLPRTEHGRPQGRICRTCKKKSNDLRTQREREARFAQLRQENRS